MIRAAKLFVCAISIVLVLGSTKAEPVMADVIGKTGNQEETVHCQIDFQKEGIQKDQVDRVELIFTVTAEYADGCIGYEREGAWVADYFELSGGMNRIMSSSIHGNDSIQVQLWNVTGSEGEEGTAVLEQIIFYDQDQNAFASIGDQVISWREEEHPMVMTNKARSISEDENLTMDGISDIENDRLLPETGTQSDVWFYLVGTIIFLSGAVLYKRS